MPELPEVETVRRMLAPVVTGRRLLGIEHDDPARYAAAEAAVGRRVRALRRRGKYLIFALEGGLELIAHLGMSGSLRLDAGTHTRARLELEGATVYFNDPRRFGRLVAVPAGDYAALPTLARMGPEPLSRGFTANVLAARLARTARPIKPALLSQEPVAGLGNIYADEALWKARLHPARPANRLAPGEVRRLHRAVRAVLRRAVELGGSTLGDGVYTRPDGEPGYFQIEHAVYGRAGAACPRCGAKVARFVLGGRSTHVCPRCQRL
ncbi:bifunctional DNA-formamidopyrimidine glycosylase/DNA-(apurinic or apyrimidinic site) lyase [Oceanithermus sp.]|uniref:bifunctional DNA-formamidopyrimidine glycosylase/DNA-(apurinic or apyrimidinic site) lyase n=1 Tax=Oceanithermus sp. TaxID=2268145 RepID=UPI00257C79A0|nr:bifunctional DNA-formamidopyrimidine glycosylase/DNA-(apurinic or apyrimidinic site) lyase [Oceanithermus sp.]